jgi:hypothetical protein
VEPAAIRQIRTSTTHVREVIDQQYEFRRRKGGSAGHSGQDPSATRAVRVAACFTLAVLAALVSGCVLAGGTLGGREKCWPEDAPRAATLWRGTLRIDASGAWLDSPEGDVVALLPGALTMHPGNSGVGELTSGSDVVARTGDEVTLFGGMASDGTMVVCGVEEIHSP